MQKLAWPLQSWVAVGEGESTYVVVPSTTVTVVVSAKASLRAPTNIASKAHTNSGVNILFIATGLKSLWGQLRSRTAGNDSTVTPTWGQGR